jgi:hypothetical protein
MQQKRYKITNQEQLLQWLMQQTNLPPSIKRSVDSGNIENLGFFKIVPGSSNPGWIIRIKTKPERLIVVSVPRNERNYWWWIKEAPK